MAYLVVHVCVEAAPIMGDDNLLAVLSDSYFLEGGFESVDDNREIQPFFDFWLGGGSVGEVDEQSPLR